jgi:hypothetical protein
MELALEQSDVVVKAIVEAVATAGELKVPRILDDRIQDETGRKMSRPAYPYQEHVFATIGGKFVYCAWNPKNLVAPAMIMQLHLSHFSDVSEFLGWSSDTFGDLTDEILRARIRRGDFCVDLGLPFEALEQALYQPRATKVVKWTSRRRTLYIGAKPRQSYIYEKSVPVSSLDYVDQKFIGDGRNGVVKATRLEVRHHGAYLKVPNLAGLEVLRRIDPFEHLHLFHLDETVVSNIRFEKHPMLGAFLYARDRWGAHHARRIFNRQGNFSRSIGKHLGSVDDSILRNAWNTRRGRFLGIREKQ